MSLKRTFNILTIISVTPPLSCLVYKHTQTPEVRKQNLKDDPNAAANRRMVSLVQT